MASSIVLTLSTVRSSADNIARLLKSNPRDQARVLANYFMALAGGLDSANLTFQTSAAAPVASTATITITHANVTNADTTTILGTVITAATSGNGTTSWTIGANATADATALAACINANTTLTKYVVASSAAGVVTLTAKQKGLVGNVLLANATSDATAFALVQWTGGTGGAESAASTFSLGL